jgi:D-amino-acid oxidase
MSTARTDVVIVGAGVSGLTVGVCLAERGFRVRIKTDRPPGRTTSAAAGAIWDPILAEHPEVPAWSIRTHQVFTDLERDPTAGIRLVDGTEAVRTPGSPPAWARELPGYRECRPADLPAGFAGGWRYTAPIIDMPVYLDYLAARLKRAGGHLEFGRLRDLDEAFEQCSVVVNCAGSGARELVPDPEVEPIRGQLVVVRNPGLTEFFAEHTDDLREMTYLLPQGEVLVLGGSAEQGVHDPVADAGVAGGILERCIGIFPQIAAAQVLEHRVGIRPKRAKVRLEHQARGARHIVHNYGHSGSGVSLSWGCAIDVADLVQRL